MTRGYINRLKYKVKFRSSHCALHNTYIIVWGLNESTTGKKFRGLLQCTKILDCVSSYKLGYKNKLEDRGHGKGKMCYVK